VCTDVKQGSVFFEQGFPQFGSATSRFGAAKVAVCFPADRRCRTDVLFLAYYDLISLSLERFRMNPKVCSISGWIGLLRTETSWTRPFGEKFDGRQRKLVVLSQIKIFSQILNEQLLGIFCSVSTSMCLSQMFANLLGEQI